VRRDLQREASKAELAQLRLRFDVLKTKLEADRVVHAPHENDPAPYLELKIMHDKIAEMRQNLGLSDTEEN
jgi:hypothetical protein